MILIVDQSVKNIYRNVLLPYERGSNRLRDKSDLIKKDFLSPLFKYKIDVFIVGSYRLGLDARQERFLHPT